MGPLKNIIIAVLCKTCNVLLCVLEQLSVDNSSAGPNWLKVGHVHTYVSFSLDKPSSIYNEVYSTVEHKLTLISRSGYDVSDLIMVIKKQIMILFYLM